MEELIQKIDVEQLMTDVLAYLPKVGAALLLLVVFWILYRVTRRLMVRAMGRAGMDAILTELLVGKFYKYAMYGAGIVMAADQLGFNIATALAGIGIAGIAIGFAAQDSVANVIAGILIFWDTPFVVGDWIRTEGEFGKVTNITLRSTRIRTPRNTYVVIPNKRIIDEVMENYSKHGNLRIDVPVGIAYKEDIPAARAVLLEAVAPIDKVLADPAADVVVAELGDSSVNLHVRVWIESADVFADVSARVVEASKLALDAADIEIPFPHLQLFVDDVRDQVWEKAARFPALQGRG